MLVSEIEAKIMNKFWKIMSYVTTAILGSALTMAVVLGVLLSGTSRQNTTVGTDASKLAELENLLTERFVGDVDVAELEDVAAAAMVDAIDDKWSYYISAEDYQDYLDDMANAYVGVGITIQANEEPRGLRVIQVNSSGPAWEAGVRVGDIMVSVGDVDIRELSTDETSALVKGEEGTSVDITFLREGEELTFSIQRRQVAVEVVTGEMLEGNVGLVTITNFHSGCADAAIAAIEDLLEQGAESLIFDVRNNGGGYAGELVNLLDYLLPEGTLFRTVRYDGVENVDVSDGDCLEMPMAVLANRNSYSAAEFFVAALMEYDWATFVGEQTTGKGRYQVCYQLSDGSAVNLSIGEYFTPNGNNLADIGLTPDVAVEVDEETFYAIYGKTLPAAEDPQIQAALEILKN